MKVIYVAGKYTGKTKSEISDNIAKAEEAAIQLWKLGWAVFCPHKNTSHFEIYEKVAGITYDTWINGGLELLSRCDAIFLLDDWEESNGSLKEKMDAVEQGIPVFFQEGGYPLPLSVGRRRITDGSAN